MDVNSEDWQNEKITVCAACHMASCWQGIHMCCDAQTADVTSKTRRELIALNREHICYMKTDAELAT